MVARRRHIACRAGRGRRRDGTEYESCSPVCERMTLAVRPQAQRRCRRVLVSRACAAASSAHSDGRMVRCPAVYVARQRDQLAHHQCANSAAGTARDGGGRRRELCTHRATESISAAPRCAVRRGWPDTATPRLDVPITALVDQDHLSAAADVFFPHEAIQIHAGREPVAAVAVPSLERVQAGAQACRGASSSSRGGRRRRNLEPAPSRSLGNAKRMSVLGRNGFGWFCAA